MTFQQKTFENNWLLSNYEYIFCEKKFDICQSYSNRKCTANIRAVGTMRLGVAAATPIFVKATIVYRSCHTNISNMYHKLIHQYFRASNGPVFMIF